MPSERYLQALNDLLREVVLEGSNVTRWHEAISLLRQALLPYLHGHTMAFAEDLWQQARVLIGQIAVRSEVQRAWRAEQRTEILRGIEADLLISFEFNELLDILVRGLSRLGVSDFYLVLYENYADVKGLARLALAYQDGQRLALDPAQQVFPARNLLPDGLLSKDTSYGLVIEALTLREEQIGFIVFKTDPPADSAECDIYPALRIELSSALKGIRLRQKLHDARRQAEEADQLKSRFLSMVSHELRTPLNLIVGLSEMAMRQQARGKGTIQVIEKFLEQIYVSGQHLDRLIRDVLDLASSQAGQMNLICKQLDLVPVLNDAANIGQQLAGQKNLVFRAEIPPQLPHVWGDRTRLRQILLNLLSNAVKFTAHGEVVLRAVAKNGNITISVADTGLGIAKEEQELIFSEFHQTDRTTARGYGGIGLGLAITRRLVEMHGGRIWVTSTGLEGGGSNFHFSIPALTEEFMVDEDKTGKRDGIVQILTKTRGGAQKLLQRMIHHGFIVEELALDDHPNFMEMLVASPPGAVVLDLAPAAELGWEIMKRLKETPCTQDIPVLFYSLMTEEDVGAVFEMDYLTKPVGTEQLIQALERHGLKASGQKDGKTILIIDDEQGILELHARMIQSELPLCKVLTAQTGYQGLDIMRNISPDLVLLDLMMPELDGFGVLRLMQEEQMLRGIPVIILSAQVLTEREMAALNQGVAAVLGKGLFTTKETIARIEGALARNKRLGSETQRMVHHGMAYIHEHYREQISRADVANHLSVNEQYLSRAFNRELGIGPMAYLSRYRIQQAKRLLEGGTMSITQIALEVGFTSQSYFSRIFQQETGVTPSAYQRGERI
jgi:signal transduction histidine kinase/DNA-binding response OmpR family regulator